MMLRIWSVGLMEMMGRIQMEMKEKAFQMTIFHSTQAVMTIQRMWNNEVYEPAGNFRPVIFATYLVFVNFVRLT